MLIKCLGSKTFQGLNLTRDDFTLFEECFVINNFVIYCFTCGFTSQMAGNFENQLSTDCLERLLGGEIGNT